ncbi:DinB family protein [Granulicella sp. dw_53]|uniref:DinB family protein n=1 Tax=Granulicella sp. dw_53 TaxID=2719792 RepID=UPI001BD462ED|nr:DinB family protein [Granulicella sp. dw_53]
MRIQPTRASLLALLLLAPFAHPQAPTKAEPPATLRSILLNQLQSTHDKAEWFVPVNTAIANLTPEQARWIPKSETPNPAPADHSVGMLAYHLLFWNTNALARFKGEKTPPTPDDNNETFNKFDATSWSQTVQKLDAVLTAWEQAVLSADEATLQKNATTIAHIGTHNAYHTGQIIEIRKLQGSWDPAKGVK